MMSTKTAKLLKKYADLVNLPYENVKRTFLNGDDQQQAIDLKEIKKTIKAMEKGKANPYAN